MTDRYDTISFFSDHGRTDEFVGLVHSVVRHLAPDTRVIDITHEIAPYDVRGGGLAVARAAQ
ncbi:MAG: SAM-dependent chlorinase/fluorinase, partial [Actinomycetes bacterium]